jgi:cytochrome c-type biogenesis protein CcmF
LLLAYTKQNNFGGPAVHEPGIYRGLIADLYLAPVIEAESDQELTLHKGETSILEGLDIKLLRFTMSGDTSGDVKAYALLEVTKDGIVQEVNPELLPRIGQLIPVPLTVFNRYEISLTAINTNEGMAKMTVRDLAAEPKPEKLDAEISRKPLMSLIWLGTILVTIGTGWAALKRSCSTSHQSSPSATIPNNIHNTKEG